MFGGAAGDHFFWAAEADARQPGPRPEETSGRLGRYEVLFELTRGDTGTVLLGRGPMRLVSRHLQLTEAGG